MSIASVGDLSRALALRSANSRNKNLLTTLTGELSTGQKSDLPKSLGGDTRRVAGIEHRLRTLDALRRNCAEVGGRLEAGQEAMAAMQAISTRVGTALVATSMMAGPQLLDARLADSRANLEAAIGLLNTQHAGEFVLAGARVTSQPVAGAAALLAEVTTAISGLTDIGDVIAAVDGFFDAPAGQGGYVDRVYLGSAGGSGAVSISAERAAGTGLTAAAQPFRELLKGLTLAALVADRVVGGRDGDRLAAAQAAGLRIVAAEAQLTQARTAHGVLQETVELARGRNAAETSALQIARSEVVAADPYETAAALSQVQVQLETLYAVTARLSQLSLARRL